MENAAKALLMTGGILIAILLLTLFAYLFGQMAESTSNIYDTLEKSEIAEFNQQFLNYEGRGSKVVGYEKDENGAIDKSKLIYDWLTVQDVATLINLAQDNNNNKKFPTKIAVYYDEGPRKYNWEDKNVFKWLTENQISDQKYRCTQVHVNTKTLLVDEIYIMDF